MAYANGMLSECVRPMLIRMVEWKIGLENSFRVDTGKLGKYIERHLYSDQWQLFAASFAGGNYDDMMKGLLSMGELFRACGREVGEALGFTYPEEDDRRVSAYIRCGGRFEKIEELLNRARTPPGGRSPRPGPSDGGRPAGGTPAVPLPPDAGGVRPICF